MQSGKLRSRVDILKAFSNLSSFIQPSTSSLLDTCGSAREDPLNSQKILRIPQTLHPSEESAPFILTPFNQNPSGTSFRSPYTFRYYPKLDGNDAIVFTNPQLRMLEQKAFVLFKQYTRLYYGNEALANCYVTENEEAIQLGYICFKQIKGQSSTDPNGKTQATTNMSLWCSTHLIDIKGDPTKSVTIKTSSSVCYQIQLNDEEGGSTLIHGSLRKNKNESKRLMPNPPQASTVATNQSGIGTKSKIEIKPKEIPTEDLYVAAFGKAVEEVENWFRSQIYSVGFKRNNDMLANEIRSQQGNQRSASTRDSEKSLAEIMIAFSKKQGEKAIAQA